MGEFVEDGQGALPAVAGFLVLAGGVVGVAQVGEYFGFLETVAEFPVQPQCLANASHPVARRPIMAVSGFAGSYVISVRSAPPSELLHSRRTP
ncbi:hypothetical protein [Streptomyces bungoensis]|uniref:hypothetical protein n=1 Tax=Streptomyces bungoensis TaxID=285568 RepID=UPI003442164C